MRIVVFGASGKLGAQIVQRALQAGHEVRAAVRQPAAYPLAHSRLEIVPGDIYAHQEVSAAIKASDAVISALGMPARGRQLICSDGMAAILPAMQHHGVTRLLAISAFGASEQRNYGLYTRFERVVIPRPMADKDKMETLVTGSTLEWTIIRPGMYLDLLPRSYQIKSKPNRLWLFSSRRGVASFVIDELTEPVHIGQMPIIGI